MFKFTDTHTQKVSNTFSQKKKIINMAGDGAECESPSSDPLFYYKGKKCRKT